MSKFKDSILLESPTIEERVSRILVGLFHLRLRRFSGPRTSRRPPPKPCGRPLHDQGGGTALRECLKESHTAREWRPARPALMKTPSWFIRQTINNSCDLALGPCNERRQCCRTLPARKGLFRKALQVWACSSRPPTYTVRFMML